jgi:hypothetical protein
MQSMDKFHAIELQQHECSCESQLSPGVFVLNFPTSSEQQARRGVSGELRAREKSVRTTAVANLTQTLVGPARALANDRRIPVQLIRRAQRRILCRLDAARRRKQAQRERETVDGRRNEPLA